MAALIVQHAALDSDDAVRTVVNSHAAAGGSSTTAAALDANALRTIPTAALAMLAPSLRYLSLHRNLVASITHSALVAFPQLRYLDLGANRIDNIENGAFEDLVSLHTLRLDHNRLMEVPNNLPASLVVLSLAHNRIHAVRHDAFANLPRLARLDLSANQIAAFPAASCFNNSLEITALSLEDNLLTGCIDPSLFSPTRFPLLASIFLHHNLFLECVPESLFLLPSLRVAVLDSDPTSRLCCPSKALVTLAAQQAGPIRAAILGPSAEQQHLHAPHSFNTPSVAVAYRDPNHKCMYPTTDIVGVCAMNYPPQPLHSPPPSSSPIRMSISTPKSTEHTPSPFSRYAVNLNLSPDSPEDIEFSKDASPSA